MPVQHPCVANVPHSFVKPSRVKERHSRKRFESCKHRSSVQSHALAVTHANEKFNLHPWSSDKCETQQLVGSYGHFCPSVFALVCVLLILYASSHANLPRNDNTLSVRQRHTCRSIEDVHVDVKQGLHKERDALSAVLWVLGSLCICCSGVSSKYCCFLKEVASSSCHNLSCNENVSRICCLPCACCLLGATIGCWCRGQPTEVSLNEYNLFFRIDDLCPHIDISVILFLSLPAFFCFLLPVIRSCTPQCIASLCKQFCKLHDCRGTHSGVVSTLPRRRLPWLSILGVALLLHGQILHCVPLAPAALSDGLAHGLPMLHSLPSLPPCDPPLPLPLHPFAFDDFVCVHCLCSFDVPHPPQGRCGRLEQEKEKTCATAQSGAPPPGMRNPWWESSENVVLRRYSSLDT